MYYVLTVNNLKLNTPKKFHLQYHQRTLKINLTNELQDLYTENYIILLQEIKENLNKCRNIPCSGLEDSMLSGSRFTQN